MHLMGVSFIAIVRGRYVVPKNEYYNYGFQLYAHIMHTSTSIMGVVRFCDMHVTQYGLSDLSITRVRCE